MFNKIFFSFFIFYVYISNEVVSLHFCFRSSLFCWSSVPPRVLVQTYQAFPTLLWPPSSLRGEAPALPPERLQALAQVGSRFSRPSGGHWFITASHHPVSAEPEP